MTDRIHVRVTIDETGKAPVYELMCDGHKVTDMSWTEVMGLAMQAVSSLRWLPRK